jgi:hypothetical protein
MLAQEGGVTVMPPDLGQVAEEVVDIPIDPGPPIVSPQRQQVGVQPYVKMPRRYWRRNGVRPYAFPTPILSFFHTVNYTTERAAGKDGITHGPVGELVSSAPAGWWA